MRRINLYLILFIVQLVLLACDNANNSVNQDAPLHIDITNWKLNKLIPNEIIASTEFIPLETDNNNLIGQINKMLVSNGNIYILDKSSKQIFVFDMTGKFIQKIGVYGRGPGEYIRLNDFIIDKSRNRVLTLDSYQRKI